MNTTNKTNDTDVLKKSGVEIEQSEDVLDLEKKFKEISQTPGVSPKATASSSNLANQLVELEEIKKKIDKNLTTLKEKVKKDLENLKNVKEQVENEIAKIKDLEKMKEKVDAEIEKIKDLEKTEQDISREVKEIEEEVEL